MKARILDALRRERCVSGERLGQQLRISRTAVWKHINELRADGYQIDSSPRLGYSLVATTDLLLPGEIGAGLKTGFMGGDIRHYRELGSTQDAAAELARNGAAEGTIVIAEAQTQGRGRKGRGWLSPAEGGVYLSVVLRPPLTPLQTIQLPLVAGLALQQAIRRTAGVEPRIKWPNDIVIGGRKAAGILTEMSCEIDRVNYVVLGIGINVNTPRPVMAAVPGGSACSLASERGAAVSRVGLVQCLLGELEDVYTEFRERGFGLIRERWRAASGTIGSWVRISGGGGESIEGQAADIDADGFLMVRKKSGDLVRVVGGEVSIRSMPNEAPA